MNGKHVLLLRLDKLLHDMAQQHKNIVEVLDLSQE